MVSVVFGRHVLVGFFGGVMFGCMLVGCYGRKWWYHMPHQCYSKMWWQHMFNGGMSHVLSFFWVCNMYWSRV